MKNRGSKLPNSRLKANIFGQHAFSPTKRLVDLFYFSVVDISIIISFQICNSNLSKRFGHKFISYGGYQGTPKQNQPCVVEVKYWQPRVCSSIIQNLRKGSSIVTMNQPPLQEANIMLMIFCCMHSDKPSKIQISPSKIRQLA